MLYFMKILILLIFPVACAAECSIGLDEIVPLVKSQLQPLHERANSKIERIEFVNAHQGLSEIVEKLDGCAEYYHEYELECLHFENWGKWSDRYMSTSMALKSVEMQLQAAVDSFDIRIFRRWLFDIDMWEKVAQEFYDREI